MPETPDIDPISVENEPLQPCGLGRRILVMAYDALALIALMMVVTALMLMTPLRDQKAFVDILPTFILFITWYVYLAWCWQRGLTLGMRAWRVKIEFYGDNRAGWGRYGLRFLASLISAACLGLGFIWSLIDSRHQTWHDKASSSRLVRIPR